MLIFNFIYIYFLYSWVYSSQGLKAKSYKVKKFFNKFPERLE